MAHRHHSFFTKPENALKRFHELDETSTLDDRRAVLDRMHGTVLNRRFRGYIHDGTVQSDLMLCHVRLSIELGDVRTLRDGLYAYRPMVQHNNPTLMVRVLNEAVERAQESLPVQEVMLVFKMVLELTKTSSKIEHFYHQIVAKAVKLCVDQERHYDFKRLIDIVRNHRAGMARLKSRADRANLLKKELHLNTRIIELEAAVKLELWRSAYDVAQDCVELGVHERPLPENASVHNELYSAYLGHVAELLFNGKDMLNHAFALYKQYQHNCQRRSWESNDQHPEKVRLADRLVIAVAAVDPLCANSGSFSCNAILGHGSSIDREYILERITRQGIQNICSAPVSQIMDFKLSKGGDLYMCQYIQVLVDKVLEIYSDQTHIIEGYLDQLRTSVVAQLLDIVQEVYSSIKISHLCNDLIGSNFMSWDDLEHQILDLCDQGALLVQINIQEGFISFIPTATRYSTLSQKACAAERTIESLFGRKEKPISAERYQEDKKLWEERVQSSKEFAIKERERNGKILTDESQKDVRRREAEVKAEAERIKKAKQLEDERKRNSKLNEHKTLIAHKIIAEIQSQLPEDAKHERCKGIDLRNIDPQDIVSGKLDHASIMEFLNGAKKRKVQRTRNEREAEERHLNWTIRAIREEAVSAYQEAGNRRIEEIWEKHNENTIKWAAKHEEENMLTQRQCELVQAHSGVIEPAVELSHQLLKKQKKKFEADWIDFKRKACDAIVKQQLTKAMAQLAEHKKAEEKMAYEASLPWHRRPNRQDGQRNFQSGGGGGPPRPAGGPGGYVPPHRR